MILDSAVLTSIQESVLCWLATVDSTGTPNVSPKEMFAAEGNAHLLIANIASPESARNIMSNASICVSFVDVFKQKGYQLKGRARLIEPSQVEYPEKLNVIHQQLGGENYPVKSIIEVEIKQVKPIIAPSYWLFPETTENQQIEQALKTYGVSRKKI